MKNILQFSLLFLFLVSCGTTMDDGVQPQADYVIAFGSCNNENYAQPLWEPVLRNSPDIFIWAGDNVYADTDDAEVMKADYQKQKQQKDYQQLLTSVKVLGTWDDHDYGKNDGGAEWHFKEESQRLFLDFFDVPAQSPRRQQQGVYHSELIETQKGNIRIFLLDTRYFRSPLVESELVNRRYAASQGTILGNEQWEWLEAELTNSKAQFNILVSGIQFLSAEHGFEKWANFPDELNKLKKLLATSKARNIILLSGDRHISEFSVAEIEGLHQPLMDFTSSGLTHAYEEFSGEPNQFRKGKVIKQLSFGLLKFDFDKEKVLFEMRGKENVLLQDYSINF